MNPINIALILGFTLIISVYILYFGILVGLPVIILIEATTISIMTGFLFSQRKGFLTSIFVYIFALAILIISSINMTGVLTLHIYAGILLAVNIVLALLNIGSIRR